ncbi:TPA: hypothetical protein ACSWAW_005193, partial [Escherichia coli]
MGLGTLIYKEKRPPHSVKRAGESGQKFFLPRRSSRQAKRVRNAATEVQVHTGDLPGAWHQQ